MHTPSTEDRIGTNTPRWPRGRHALASRDRVPCRLRTRGRVVPTCRLVSTMIVLVVTLVACGPSGVVAPPAAPTPTGAVDATVTSDGGSVRVVSDDGAILDVTFPAGAVRTDTLLTIAPAPTEPDALARFSVSPSGLVFRRPVAVALQLPSGATSGDESTFALEVPGEPTVLPTARSDDGRSFTAEVRFFAFPTASDVERFDADDARMADRIAAFEARCQDEIDVAAETLDLYVAHYAFEDALRLIGRIGFLLDRCARYDEFGTWLEQADPVVCALYADAVLMATVVAVDTFKTFKQVMAPVTHGFSTVQAFDAKCDAPTAVEVFETKYVQFIEFLSARVNGLQFTAEYEDLLDEVRRVLRLRGMAEMLGADNVVGLLESRVIDPLMDLLRQRAYTECVATSDHYYLFGLIESQFLQRRVPLVARPPVDGRAITRSTSWNGHGAYGDDAIHRDLQYCGTSLDLEVWSGGGVPTAFTEQAHTMGGPSSPGAETVQASSRGPREGYLILRPDIDVFRCGQSRTLDPQSLVVRFAGVEAHRVAATGGSMPSQPIELDLAELLSGSDPRQKATRTVEIVREADACSGAYGAPSFTLFTWDVELDPAPTLELVTASSSVLVANQVTSMTFSLPFEDQGANVRTLVVEVALGGTVFVRLEDDVASSASTTGFAGETHGEGTFTEDVHIGCSEAGKNPLSFRFHLVDEFEQESSTLSTDVTVDYSGCP